MRSWNLQRGQQEFFLEQYRRASGDNATTRLPAYLLAYSVFRMAFCRMGAAAMAAGDESPRLLREYRLHRNRVASLLGLGQSGAQKLAPAFGLARQTGGLAPHPADRLRSGVIAGEGSR